MKKYMCFLLLITISLIVIPVKADLPLLGKVIVIDPGHGGLDPGTTFQNIYEKDLNLLICLELRKELSRLGATVVMTRDGDYDLSTPNAIWRKKSDFDNRIKIINDKKTDLYLSIHLNYLNESNYFGPQIFSKNEYLNEANIVQKFLNNKLNSSRKAKDIPKSTYMYSKLEKEGLLIECGFLSNYNDRKKLLTQKYQQKIANLIAISITKII